MAYTTIKLPTDLAEQIDMVIETLRLGYRSRTDFVLEAVRRRLEEIQRMQTASLKTTKPTK